MAINLSKIVAYTGSWSSRSTTTGRKISAEITLSTKTGASAHTPNNLTTAAEKPTGEPGVGTPAGGSEPVAAEPEKKSESAVKKDDKVVDEILGKLHLDNPEYSTGTLTFTEIKACLVSNAIVIPSLSLPFFRFRNHL